MIFYNEKSSQLPGLLRKWRGTEAKKKTKGGKCIFTYSAFPRLLLRCHESLNIQTEFESMNYAKTVSLRAAQCTLEFCLLR